MKFQNNICSLCSYLNDVLLVKKSWQLVILFYASFCNLFYNNKCNIINTAYTNSICTVFLFIKELLCMSRILFLHNFYHLVAFNGYYFYPIFIYTHFLRCSNCDFVTFLRLLKYTNNTTATDDAKGY